MKCTKIPNLVQEGSAMSLFVTPYSDFSTCYLCIYQKARSWFVIKKKNEKKKKKKKKKKKMKKKNLMAKEKVLKKVKEW